MPTKKKKAYPSFLITSYVKDTTMLSKKIALGIYVFMVTIGTQSVHAQTQRDLDKDAQLEARAIADLNRLIQRGQNSHTQHDVNSTCRFTWWKPFACGKWARLCDKHNGVLTTEPGVPQYRCVITMPAKAGKPGALKSRS